MLATEIKKIRKGKCFQVLEDLYGVDIDKLVSKDISDKAFVGTLTGIYTKEELFQIVINLTNIVSGDYPDMIKKGEIPQPIRVSDREVFWHESSVKEVVEKHKGNSDMIAC